MPMPRAARPDCRAEAEAVVHEHSSDRCGVRSPDSAWGCSRKRLHVGPHIASYGAAAENTIILRWGWKEEP